MKFEGSQELNNLARTKLLDSLVDDLSVILLNEKIPLDVVNGQNGEIIVPANQRFTKSLLRRMAENHDRLDIDRSPIRDKVREIINRFEERLTDEQLRIARGQFPESLERVELRKRAENGDPQAQYELGFSYKNGTDMLGRNPEKAKLLFKAAADKGNINALTCLGICYSEDNNLALAKQCFQEASTKGDAEAHYLLAGLSPEREAICLYHAAAKKGNPQAMRKLGDYWALGRDHWWFRHGVQLAAYSFNEESSSLEDYTGTGRADKLDRAEAAEWYRLAADHNDAEAQRKLGDCYIEEWVVPKRFEEGTPGYREKQGAKWYRKAAEQGDAEAQQKLACCYENGIGVAQSEVQAAKWYGKAGSQGDEFFSYEALGDLYSRMGEKRKAAKAYRKAGFRGSSSKIRNLGPKSSW